MLIICEIDGDEESVAQHDVLGHVGLDQFLDEFLDDVVGGVIGGQFGDVFGAFECEHGWVSF